MPATKTKKSPPTTEEQLKKKEEAIAWAKATPPRSKHDHRRHRDNGSSNKDPDTEIVSLSMINNQGRPILASLVNPGRPIPMEAPKDPRD